jgi:hypothetical protein
MKVFNKENQRAASGPGSIVLERIVSTCGMLIGNKHARSYQTVTCMIIEATQFDVSTKIFHE